MTWSTWDTHRRTRVAATAAALVGALALTACSGDSGSEDEPSPGSGTSASASASGGADTGGDGGSAGSSGELQGSWLATTGGKAVALVITGDQAALFTTGGSVCSGMAKKASSARTIRLSCTDGNKDRASGVVDAVTGTSLKVTWKSGLGTEEYTRSEGGTLPSGLPTASLGS
ncbi:hypothetical protein ACFYRY_30760 [Streptomyces sp. NPDC005263]|uniref:hypothetical protein n=1 Tax=Streptomyces sp. NPDC005263 TaxID=3364711 RepID=UPI003697D6F6